MTTMSGIIVGIDGSQNAQPALDWAVTEAALRAVPLTVVTVNEALASYWTGQPVPSMGDDERLAHARKAAEDAVAEAVARFGEDQQPSVTVDAVNGFPAQVLIDVSRGADLLIVGTRGGGGFAHLSLGGVASKVLHHAYCPVVVVPHDR
jgi:nucleotide-binding universal stress UspA family protein